MIRYFSTQSILRGIRWAVAGLTLFSSINAYSAEGGASGNESRLLSNIRQLIFEGKRSGEGYFSADGSRMVFQSEREPDNPFYQIYLMDLETGDVNRVSPGSGKTSCGWIHSDGERVLFASSHADPDALKKQKEELDKRASGKASRYSWSFDEHYDLFQADSDGGNLKRLTDALGYDAEGSWSPDGSLIAFGSNRHAYSAPRTPEEEKTFGYDKSYFMEIYIMNSDGSGLKRLTDAPGYDGGPFFSPDGKRITWRRFTPEGDKAEIWTMNTDGSDQRPITQLGVMSWAPFYHPSGDYIIFATNRHGYGNFELYIVDSEGRFEPVRVTDTEGFDGLPVFSPDGTRLAWTSKRSANKKPQIFMADWDDAEARKLLNLNGDKQAAVTKPAPQPPLFEKTSDGITPEDMRLHVEYLASESMGGRVTGSEGEQLAGAYVADLFSRLGLLPAGDDGSFFQPFEFTAGISLGAGNRLHSAVGGERRDHIVSQDWQPLSFSSAGKVKPAEVVFAGYGIVAPATDDLPAYDSYGELDVKGKWVMALRYMPEGISAERRQQLANYFDFRYKAMVARDKGALGLIVVSGPNSKVVEQLVKLEFDTALASVSIAVLSMTDALGEELIAATGEGLKARQDRLDRGEPGEAVSLPGVKLGAEIKILQERRKGRNVLGRLPAGDGPGETALVVGAHLDHIGDGVGFDSLAGKDEYGRVHPGADDNASGVAGLLEIAQYLTEQKRRGKLKAKRDILFAAWSGEEIGMLGSKRFTRDYQANRREGDKLSPFVSAYLNMDMIGRLDKSLFLQGVGSSSLWAREIERRNVPVGLSVVLQEASYLPTDATNFYIKGVPILSAFTGTHADYNTPRDRPETLNYEGAAKVARLIGLITRSLAKRAEPADYIASAKPVATASRRNLRAFVGTIPEYGASDIKGVKLNGVAENGPADKAGLKGGDIIVEVGGKAIENIYDYTYALNAVKVGQAVKFTVERNGERVVLEVMPEARE